VSSKSTKVDWEFLPEIASAAARRIPGVMDAGLQTSWAGLVELTPDKLPILGPVSGVRGFICANGLSGHGVMLSPAVGRAVASMILDSGPPGEGVAELSIERFSKWAGRIDDLMELALKPYL
jgi:sarcosine oxidase subunit beta